MSDGFVGTLTGASLPASGASLPAVTSVPSSHFPVPAFYHSIVALSAGVGL